MNQGHLVSQLCSTTMTLSLSFLYHFLTNPGLTCINNRVSILPVIIPCVLCITTYHMPTGQSYFLVLCFSLDSYFYCSLYVLTFNLDSELTLKLKLER